jgi:ubiquitin carboxyl-terminal hydrolase 16/45
LQNFFNFPHSEAGVERLVPFTDMLFGGKLSSILVCQKCKHVSQTYEDFVDLSLPIKPEDYARGRKRDVLKNLAKKLIHVNVASGFPVARSSSVPPTPRREDGPGPDAGPVGDQRRRSLDHAVVSTEALAISKELPYDDPTVGDGVQTSAPVEGEAVTHAKEESQDLGQNQKDSKEKKEKSKEKEDSWSKLSRRISVTVGFGTGYKERAKEKHKGQEQERERVHPEGVTAKGDSVKDTVQNSGASDPDRPAPHPPEDARSPSTPEVLSPQPQPHPALSPVSQLTGRFASIQRPSLSRSNSKLPQPPKLSSREAAYLRKLLADTLPANPFARFKPQVGHDSAQTLWLKLGQLPGVEECLRMFTAVEMLDGENSVGCRRCWKVMNGVYKPKHRREVDATLEESDSDSEVEIASSPEPISKGTSLLADTINVRPGFEGRKSTAKDSPSSSSLSVEISDRASVSTGPTTLESGVPKMGTLSVTTFGDTLQPSSRPPSNTTPGGFPIPVISTTEPPSPTRQPVSPLVEVESSLRAPPRWVKVSHQMGKDDSDESDGFDSETSVESESSGEGSRSHTTAVPHSAPPHSYHRNFSPSSYSGVPRSKQVVLRPAYKRYLIASAPPVLIIHLKRFQQISKTIPISFSHGFRKLDDYVAFPEYLDLGPFMAPRKEDFGLQEKPKRIEFKPKEAEPCKYRLYAVVVHTGNIVRIPIASSFRDFVIRFPSQLGGHYVAYVALPQPRLPPTPAESTSTSGENSAQKPPPQRQWAYVSDTHVRLTNLEEVLKAKAYICMYERL